VKGRSWCLIGHEEEKMKKKVVLVVGVLSHGDGGEEVA